MTKPLATYTAALALTLGIATHAHAQAPTEVTFWGDWAGQGQIQFNTMVDAFNASQKQVHVTYVVVPDMITKFLTASVSGQTPDLMWWDRPNTALYAPKNVLAPIDDLMQRDHVKASDFYSEALKELTYQGKTYGLPATVDARAIFYNKTLFKQAGLQPPTNWATLESAAKKLTRWNGSRLERAGFDMSDPGLFNMYLQQAGGSMLTSDGQKTNFNNAKGLEVLNYWNTLLNKDRVYQWGFGQGLQNGQDPFVTGRVAMLYTGPWNITTYKKYGQNLDFGVVPAPAGPNGDKGSVMGGFGLVIPAASKKRDAAWAFMKWWLATPKNAVMWGKTSYNIPGNLQAIKDPFFQNDPYFKPILTTLSFARIRPTVTGYSPMEGKALVPHLQEFMQGKESAAQALQAAQTEGDRQLAQNNLK